MRTQATAGMAASPGLPIGGLRSPRVILALLTAIALLATGIAVGRSPASTVDPDFTRVIRFMALIKGGFALTALVACFWRLRRHAASWRMAVYVLGPPVMVAGAVELWSLHNLGMAALGLHLGLFAVIAAALTDPDFLTQPSGTRTTVPTIQP